MADTPKTVTVKARQLHTYHGHTYDVGDTYEADAGDVETIEVQGKGARVGRDHTYQTTEAPVPHKAVLTAQPAHGVAPESTSIFKSTT